MKKCWLLIQLRDGPGGKNHVGPMVFTSLLPNKWRSDRYEFWKDDNTHFLTETANQVIVCMNIHYLNIWFSCQKNHKLSVPDLTVINLFCLCWVKVWFTKTAAFYAIRDSDGVLGRLSEGEPTRCSSDICKLGIESKCNYSWNTNQKQGLPRLCIIKLWEKIFFKLMQQELLNIPRGAQ